MKKIFGVAANFMICSLLLFGCINQLQPTAIATTASKPTATYQSIGTPQVSGVFLPTVTLPPYTVAPTMTLTPLPKDAFDNFDELAGYCMIKTLFGKITPGAIIQEHIISDLSVGKIWFSLYWSQGDLDLTLVQPDGTVLDPSTIGKDEKIQSFMSEHGSEQYSILAPQVGIWQARIFGKTTSSDGTPYMLEIWSTNATSIFIQFDKKEYNVGDPIKITVSLHDSDVSVANNRDVQIQVTTADPTTNIDSFDLYDDGTHGDEKAGDGVFTSVLRDTSAEGTYKFYFKISGHNQKVFYANNDPQRPTRAPFERECFSITEVKK